MQPHLVRPAHRVLEQWELAAAIPAPITLPQRIAAKRRQLGLSIEQAAKIIGVEEGTFSRWESGRRKPRMSEGAVRILWTLKGYGEGE